MEIQIHPIGKSRIDEVDFNNLAFGRSFADHMLIAEYANGAWQSMTIQPYGPLSYQPAMMSIHYGQSIFEGMKAFKNSDGKIVLAKGSFNAA